MNEFWNSRYAIKNYVYGTEPNRFFKDFIDKMDPGKILMPGEGEGRNGVYAALKGWQVDAFDASPVAKQKALKLAEDSQVNIKYTVESVDNYRQGEVTYDMIALIFLHLPPDTRSVFHLKMSRMLSVGGKILLEAFSKNQIHYPSGGPKIPELLYSLEELMDDFSGLKILSAEQKLTLLNEGEFHQGVADVIRLIAEKE